jgi:hypothetical protein
LLYNLAVTCAGCQRVAPEGSRFCPWCGRALEDEPSATRLVEPLETVAADLPTMMAAPSAAGSYVGTAEPVAPSAAVTLTPGTLLAARYRIGRQLGRGGMGVVYQADDLRLGHRVALKFLPAAFAGDPRRLAQFHNEVSVARQVSHPNVCRVYDIGEVDGHLFLSMEYVEGEDLAAMLGRRGPIPEEEAIELIRQICAGLAAVHARGALHRDLKPANIMLNTAGQVQLMDFGIAAIGDTAGATRPLEGTPAYMAPEQFARGEVSTRSDIYALGLVMREIVTGERLLTGTTVEALTQQQETASVDGPAWQSMRASPRLQQAIRQCLHLDPSQRPASAPAVAAMLQTVLLDARATTRRVLQVVIQVLTIPLLLVGGNVIARSITTGTIRFSLLAVVLLLVAFELRYPLAWAVSYKGHRIRFRNHAIFGERLYLDDQLVDRGRFGVNVTLRGTIESGAGAGERITASVRCSYTNLSCRIVAESFTPSA